VSVTGDRPPRGRRIWRGIPCAAASAFASFATAEAHAHGFGQRYDLPVPLWLYLTGAGLTVALSFVAMAVFLRARPAVRDVPGINLLNTRIGRVLAAAPLRFVLRLLGVLLYLLVVLAGLLGTQSPLKNIAPVMVWAIWWVGMAYVSALVGNVWALANPLDTLFVWLERLHARAGLGRRLSLELPYPKRLGVWPAVALFLAFIWIELVWESTDVPAKLALAILAYSALTWLGMLVFGRHEWLRRGEVFAIVFGLLARFAPLEARSRDGRREWNLRPYAIGLLTSEPLHASEILLVILMLATVSFDGFIETPAWAAIAEAMIGPAPEAGPGLTDALPTATGDALVRTIGLIVAPLLFLSVYLIVCELMVRYGAPALLPSGARYGGRAGSGAVRPHADPDRHRLSPLALSVVPRHRGAVLGAPRLRSVGPRLGPVRRRTLLHPDRDRGCAHRLVCVGRGDRRRPRGCGLSGARACAAGVSGSSRRVAQPIPDADADGRLHYDQPLDHRATDRIRRSALNG